MLIQINRSFLNLNSSIILAHRGKPRRITCSGSCHYLMPPPAVQASERSRADPRPVQVPLRLVVEALDETEVAAVAVLQGGLADEEPRVVGNQVKTVKLLLGQPPDPAVADPALERADVPAHEREPLLAQHSDVAQASPDQSPEGQIAVRAPSAHPNGSSRPRPPSGGPWPRAAVAQSSRSSCSPGAMGLSRAMALSVPLVQRPCFACRINRLPARKN